ncbi:MAG: V-type ATPase 116kDa subunit family protein [Candidatus Izemoplasmatales bacterium]
MAIAKIKLVTITSNLSSLDRILMRFIDLEKFHPVPASGIVDSVHGLTSFQPDNFCAGVLAELNQFEKEFGMIIPTSEIRSLDYDFEAMRKSITEDHEEMKRHNDRIRDLTEQIRKYEDALKQVHNIASMDVSFDDLFECKYLYARLGRLPIDSVEKLKYYRNRPFVFKSFSQDEDSSWCLYLTSPEYEREVDNIFSSLFFERIHIPDFVHGTPEKAAETLEKEIRDLEGQIGTLKAEMTALSDTYSHELASTKSELMFLNQIFEAKKYVVGLGDRFTISGFTEESNIDHVKRQFADIPDVELEFRPPTSDKRITPPTKLHNGWFSKPFGMFVEMYGVPSYGEVDPTPFFAITYSILFGVMFGDLGQGLVLALLGFLLAKFKHMKLGEIAIRIGISSAFFGLLYGSFFGNEELLTPLFTDVLGLAKKPIEVMDSAFTMTLLIAAVGIGAVLIILSMAMGVYTNLRRKHYATAFFSSNGLAGLVFYGYLLAGLALSVAGIANLLVPALMIPFLGIPLVLIFLKEPIERRMEGKKMFPNGFGGFFVEGFFELFDVLLSYITNTMSFMRVGGFILSHAGMMLVVSSLMSMVASGSWAVAVFGNIFVMGLEGLIVGIQVLRLEFYEMFSRYYEGNGIAFQPIK